MQRSTTLETTHIHATCVRLPQTPNKEPPRGPQIATESPPLHTSLGAHVQTSHHSLSVRTHPSRVDPHETDTILNLFGLWELVQDQRSYADENIFPASPTPPPPPCPRQHGVQFLSQGESWRTAERWSEERHRTPYPKSPAKRLFCFPHQEVQKGLHPAQPPTPHPQCSLTCLRFPSPGPREPKW